MNAFICFASLYRTKNLKQWLCQIRKDLCMGPAGPPEQTLEGAPSARDATLYAMTTQQPAPKIQLSTTPDYRESYANSVQVRVNLWDFLLLFGRINQTAPDSVHIQNFQGIYVSPQQAKALLNVLQQNVNQYETAFGEIRLEPQVPGVVQ
jgi:hypothetical protein